MWPRILIFTASASILAGCASSGPRPLDVIQTTAPAEAMVPCPPIAEPGPTVGDIVKAYTRLAVDYHDCAGRMTDLQLFQLDREGRARQLKRTD